MSFYGKVTNTNKTTFSFDRIYSNRREMERNVDKDGIFIGRYILIEYDQSLDSGGSDYIRGYRKASDNNKEVGIHLYSNVNKDDSSVIKLGDITSDTTVTINTIVYVVKSDEDKENDINREDINKKGTEFWICVGEKDEAAIFNKIVTSGEGSYHSNYSIDTYLYGKGYDSTVWVKSSVLTDDKFETKYVQIAELNTVVPTFDLTIDAPTSLPITPHFDTDSNNQYYKLHVQPNWGFRVEHETNKDLSDEKTYWTQQIKNNAANEYPTYITQYAVLEDNKITWKNEPPTGDEINIPAKIYYNKDAFTEYRNKDKDGKYTQDGIQLEDTDTINTIMLLPTGTSGQKYNTHKNGTPDESAPDIQELTIHLPAIGNMMHKAWDIIHGDNRDDNPINSLQGRLDFFTDNVVELDDDGNPKLDPEDGYKPLKNQKGIQTNEIPVQSPDGYLVGSRINGDKQYGNKNSDNYLDETAELSTSFDQDDAWIRTEVDTSTRNSDGQYHTNGIAIHHTFHATPDTTSYVDKNREKQTVEESANNDEFVKNQDTIDLYTPKVDAAGHVVGKNIQTVELPYGYKHITFTNTERDKVSAAPDTPKDGTGLSATKHTRTADNTQDTLNFEATNRWIRFASNGDSDTTGTSVNVDTFKYGHELLVKDTDKDTVKVVREQEATQADHDYGLVVDKTCQGVLKNDESNLDWDNTFEVPVIRFDEAGHITKAETHTVELPENFDKIVFGQSDDVTDKTSSNQSQIVADSLTDTLTFAEGNKWIYIDSVNDDKENGDKITISHYVNNDSLTENTNTSNSDFNTDTIKNFEVINSVTLDEAGHITGYNTHTHTLPYGFKTIKTNGRGNSTDNNTSAPTTSDVVADSHVDTLNLNSGNKWIKIDTDANNDILTFSHDIHSINSANKNPTDLNTTTNNVIQNTITVQDLAFDTAGHVTDNQKHTYTLPYGYKTFSDGTNNSMANNTQDTFKFAGDNWIQPTVANDQVTYAHTGPVSGTKREEGDKTPKFGGTFNIEDWTFDDKGHKSAAATHTIKIPQSAQVINLDGKQVLTNLSITDFEDNQLSFTSNNINNFQLTDYNNVTLTSGAEKADIGATDTLGQALKKLQNNITMINGNSSTEGSIKKAIADVISDAPEAFDTLKEIADWITDDTSGAASIINRVSGLETKVGNSSVNAQIVSKINALDQSDTAQDGQYVSAVSETNGIISVSRKDLPKYTLEAADEFGTLLFNQSPVVVPGLDSIVGEKTTEDDPQYTIIELSKKINSLEATINKLKEDHPELFPESTE